MFISLYDTCVGSPNLGDQIIMESVTNELEALFPNAFIHRLPTHDHIGKYGRRALAKSDLIFVGGTNILFSHWTKLRQWRMKWRDLSSIENKLIVMGSGWATYLDQPDYLARTAYNKLLSKQYAHSVRDNYSLNHLSSLGRFKVSNTGCPTLWGLMNMKPEDIDVSKKKQVVTTLTDYRKSPNEDRAMLEMLKSEYEDVALWLQGSNDGDYFRSLDVDGISIIPPSLRAFDNHLKNTQNLDFVGTRLHAGIRALQHGVRALIVVVDNRAREMGKDFGLHVMERGDTQQLKNWIHGNRPIQLALPKAEIINWRDQFSNLDNKIA